MHRTLHSPESPWRSWRANIFVASAPFVHRREQHMRKLALIVFGVCFWIAMLAAIITTVARLSTEAKERRSQNVAADRFKSRP